MKLQRCLNKEGQPFLMKWGLTWTSHMTADWVCQVKPGDCHACYVYCQEEFALLSWVLRARKDFFSIIQSTTELASVHEVAKIQTRQSDGGHIHTSRKLLLFAVVFSIWKYLRLLSQSRFGVKGRKEPLFSVWYYSRASFREVKWQQFGGQHQGQGTSIWLKLFSSL